MFLRANTMLDGRLRTMSNAFSIVTPAVTDSFVATLSATKFKHLTDWGMSSQSELPSVQAAKYDIIFH
jgi:hypothetical protein